MRIAAKWIHIAPRAWRAIVGAGIMFAALTGLSNHAAMAQTSNQVQLYQTTMLGFLHREQELESQLNAFIIMSTYCIGGHPSKEDDQEKLNALHAGYKQLQSDYKQYKINFSSLAKDHPDMMTGFDPNRMMPDNPNFWHNSDQAFAAPGGLLRTRDAELKASKVIDCEAKATATAPPPVSPPPPSPPPASAPGVLDGFARPVVPNVEIPKLPDHFCSDAEREAFIDKVKVLETTVNDAVRTLMVYRQNIEDRLLEIDQPGGSKLVIHGVTIPHTPVAESRLRAEIAWGKGEGDKLHPLSLALLNLRYDANEFGKIPTIDCNAKATPPPPAGGGKPNVASPASATPDASVKTTTQAKYVCSYEAPETLQALPFDQRNAAQRKTSDALTGELRERIEAEGVVAQKYGKLTEALSLRHSSANGISEAEYKSELAQLKAEGDSELAPLHKASIDARQCLGDYIKALAKLAKANHGGGN